MTLLRPIWRANTRVANVEFGLARRELASTGRADQVALAELTRCAVQVASLDVGPCEGFEKLRADATAAQCLDLKSVDYLGLSDEWLGIDVELQRPADAHLDVSD